MPGVRRIVGLSDQESASPTRPIWRYGSDPSAGRGHAGEYGIARLASRQHGVVTASQLRALGLSTTEVAGRARRGILHRLHSGVYAVGHTALGREGRWMAAVLAAGPEALLSHRDGTALWQIADFAGGEIEVTLPGLGSRSLTGIRIHRTRRLEPSERAVVRGIPVTTVERLMIDLAATVAPRHLRRAYHEARRRDLVDVGELDRMVAASAGRRGLRSLRRILADEGDGHARTRSELEVEFLDLCREQGLPEPLVNVWVCGYLVDAYWPDAHLVAELDSWEYHRGRDVFERDRARIGDLRLAGITVIPITDRQLMRERSRIATTMRAALASASG